MGTMKNTINVRINCVPKTCTSFHVSCFLYSTNIKGVKETSTVLHQRRVMGTRNVLSRLFFGRVICCGDLSISISGFCTLRGDLVFWES